MSASILARIVEELAVAARARSPFNFMQLASIGMDGSPQLRTIVLRRYEADRTALSFVTDIRSPKMKEIRCDGRVSLVAFDPDNSIQLRLSGEAIIVEDEAEKREAWARLRGRTLILFEAPFAPGTVIEPGSGLPDVHQAPTAPAEPYERFALVTVTLNRLEWLDLSTPDHIRWAFTRHGDDWEASRLAP